MSALLLSCLIASPGAHAASGGSMAGQPLPGSFDCGQCHNQTGAFTDLAPEDSRPAISLDLVDGGDPDVLVVGETRRLRLTVDSSRDESPHDETGRKLGLAMAVVADSASPTTERTGILDADTDDLTRPEHYRRDLSHAYPLRFADGPIHLELTLTPDVPGDHLIYVVANDVDGNGKPSTGDYVWPQRFCFTVVGADGEIGEAGPGEVCDDVLGVGPAELPDTGGAGGEETGAADGDADGAAGSKDRGCQAVSAGGIGGAWIGLLVGVWRRRRGPGAAVTGPSRLGRP